LSGRAETRFNAVCRNSANSGCSLIEGIPNAQITEYHREKAYSIFVFYQYKELENAIYKIKIQPYKMKSENNKKSEIKRLLKIIKRKDIFKNITSPEKWHRNLRDEWEKGIV